ncbi:MAG: hypothetical protein NC038_03605 [Paludibacter sp.]|nr:hypothetical protein [Bacteroidales bacterium]MCM1069165.1 hypothetical protein [Prevotella sp.]MCM1354070.1 hypothetical protein [Bacteroides sp.]MCM1442957.1 hypothetical protein [Muribaculum sp.]MCM1481720.1 hypothetical protein [Paludibacter sp.]
MLKTLLFIGILLSDTTFTEVSVQGNYSRSTYALEGASSGGFTIQAASVYDLSPRHRLFGEASYSWGQSQGNEWVENADYTRLYPYLTVDTIGGGLRTEEYFFRGGYRGLYSSVVWHIALQYTARQSYRQVDPRPENKVADLRVEGSVGYVHRQYAYSLNLNLQRYKQTNKISFYSELGETMIYHLVQPGTPYTRFAGGFKSAYYHGMAGGAALTVQPLHEGWLGAIDYQYEQITKELLQNTNTPIAQLATHQFSFSAGYLTTHWHTALDLHYHLRQGQQYMYGESTGNYYYLIGKTLNYTEHLLQFRLHARYTALLPMGKLTPYLAAHYTHPLLGSTQVQPLFSTLSARLLSPSVGLSASLEYAFPVRKRIGLALRPVAEYTHYTLTSEYTWQVRLALALTL